MESVQVGKFGKAIEEEGIGYLNKDWNSRKLHQFRLVCIDMIIFKYVENCRKIR